MWFFILEKLLSGFFNWNERFAGFCVTKEGEEGQKSQISCYVIKERSLKYKRVHGSVHKIRTRFC
jgi:hypothetical protein